MESTTLRLRQAIAAARADKKPAARILADRIIRDEPSNSHALFLLGMLADTDEERIDYLNRVLAVDPEHELATKQLAQLVPQPAEEPEEPAPESMAEGEEVAEVPDKPLSTPVFESVMDEFLAPESIVADDLVDEFPAAEVSDAEIAITEVAEEPDEGAAVEPIEIVAAELLDELIPEDLFEIEEEPSWDSDLDVADKPAFLEQTLIREEPLFAGIDYDTEEDTASKEALVSEEELGFEEALFSEELRDFKKEIAFDEEIAIEDKPVSEEEFVVEEVAEQGLDSEPTSKEDTFIQRASAEASHRIPGFLEQMAGDELPDWLKDKDELQSEQAIDEPEFRIVDGETGAIESLPDWLQEETTQEWVESEVVEPMVIEDSTEIVEDTLIEEAVADSVVEVPEEVLPVDEVKIKEKRPNRKLEILLLALVVLAVIIVGTLIFVIIVRPSF